MNTRILKKIILVFTITIFRCLGQAVPVESSLAPRVFSPSPNAASLGAYGQIPVTLYNGLPTINIELYKLKAGNYELPISLSYNLSSIKPEERPGWTGLGWNLNVGGAITRIVKGGVDEVMAADFTDPTIFSYYDHYGRLNTINWSTNTSLIDYYNCVKPLFPTGTCEYAAPDEFMFNVDGLSGSFYKNQLGNWVIKGNEHIDIKVNEEIKSDFKLYEKGNLAPDNKTFLIKRIIYGFTLTRDDGTQYIFGKNPSAIEFTAAASVNDAFHSNFVAKTWYLTKIIPPNNGNSINFEYKTNVTTSQANTDVSHKAVYKQYVSTSFQYVHNVGDFVSQSLSDGIPTIKYLERQYNVYLSRITTDDTEIIFDKSLSNDLDFNLNNSPWGPYVNDYTLHYDDAYLNVAHHWYKLDDFIVNSKNENKQVYKVNFNYLEQPTSRLFLTSIVENGLTNDTTNKTHSFEYNQTPLPPYNSQKIDHWGFYNNMNFFQSVSPSIPGPNGSFKYSKEQLRDLYPNYRQPNPAVMQAGVLTKIIFPTKGFTEFYYQPHDFSKVVNRDFNNFSLTNANSSNEIAGGLRIQKIVSNPTNNGIPVIKEYFYVKDYKNGDMSSSGILSGRPLYFEEGSSNNLTVWKLKSNSIVELSNTNGNHVTYTNVVEKLQDGSFTEFTFTNHDNGYIDKASNGYIFVVNDPNIVSVLNNDAHLVFNSMELERGKLLFEKKYNNQFNLVEQNNYYYNDDISRFNNEVRSIDIYQDVFGTTVDQTAYVLTDQVKSITKMSAYSIFTHQTFLKRKENISYDYSNGSNLTTTTDYIYTNSPNFHQRKSESFTNSIGEIVKTEYQYPPELLTSGKPNMSALVNANRINQPIITQSFKNGNLLNSQETVFANDASTSNFILPKYIYSANFPNMLPSISNIGNLEKKITYEAYDSKGNLTEYTLENSIHVSIIWGYTKIYPIAKIENSTNAQIKTALGITDYNLINETNISAINNLRGNPLFKDCMITTYTYNPLIGITSITDPKADLTTYEYDSFNRLQFIKDKNGNTLTKNEYHYKP